MRDRIKTSLDAETRRMSPHGTVFQGFRSTFRDWIAEGKEYPDSLAEEALAHIIIPQTVAAYRRRDQPAFCMRGCSRPWASQRCS